MLDSIPDLISLVKTFGPLLVVAIYFLWKDYATTTKMSERIERLEAEHRDVVLPLVRECTQVISHNSTVMERVERRLERE